MQKEAMVPLRLGRYPQALRRLTPGAASAGGRRRSRRSGRNERGSLAGTRPCSSTSAVRVRRSSGASGQSPRPETHARRGMRSRRRTSSSTGRTSRSGGSTRPSTPRVRSRSTRSSATSTGSPGSSTTSADSRYLDGRWDEALELAERARATFKKIGDESHGVDRRAEHRGSPLRPGQDGRGGAGLPRGPGRAPGRRKSRSRSRRRESLLGRHLGT